ncbi:phosphatidylglycerol--membrane-oligosaccharide glycerophosphotransferase [Martelella alba]|uniref:Phosphatidylglycerol--membrane-oligosaccharide glycerophosphotransferase n=1 Tax=Martelella alba TaxID=2590451 RepID=A0ABY2SP01_9HYPH|nr:phosphatidylglycerol--membrane-oligosaccharide glycerophosphotransferase [Martelella alba]TKI07746.1 phosphatidylglycerol--membrane-oligosaccharide glycerophosphotransferase [Martelella alba]
MSSEIFSLLLFVTSIIVYALRADRRKLWFILTLFILALFIVLNLIRAASNYFTGDGIDDSVLYTITSNLTGAGVNKYILPFVGFLAVSLSVFALMSWILLRSHGRNHNVRYSLLALFFACASVATTPAFGEIAGLVKSELSQDKSDFYTYYKTPTKIMSGQRPNLVYIYAESLEKTYFNQRVFPGLTADLDAAKANAISFNNTVQLPGTGYTIAGIVASQCGIPLFAPFDGNASSSLSTFYPHAVCLGDILRNSGYENYFYQGADLAFAGKGLFLKSHGFDHVYGYQELLGMVDDPAYKNEWGWYDDTLLDIVYNQFMALSSQNKRFALFALTVDTHHPDGYISRSCNRKVYDYNGVENKSLSAVSCSQQHIADLIEKIQRSPYFKNTIIVVSSDHLAMNNTAYSILTQNDRKDLFFMIRGDSNKKQEINAKRSTLDNGATVLDAMGGDNFIGLGRSSLSNESLATYFMNINEKINSWIPAVIKQWDFPTKIKKYKIDTHTQTIRFSGVSFKTPLILKVEKNKIEPLFDVYLSTPLNQQLAKLNANDKFVWVDECTKMADVWDEQLSQNSQTCVATGTLSTRPDIIKIDGDVYRGKVSFKHPRQGDDPDAIYQETINKLDPMNGNTP